MNEQHWTSDIEVLQRVRDSLIDFIYGMQARKADEIDETEFREIREIFDADFPPIQFPSPGDYVNRFKSWFSQHGHIYHSLKEMGQISVQRQWVLPDGGTISLSVGGSFKVRNPSSVERITDSLLNILEMQYSRINAKMFDAYKTPTNQAPKQGGGGKPKQLQQGQATVQITHLDTLYQDGRKMVRAFGGEFQRYGIPVYKEALAALGLEESQMKIAEKVPVNRLGVIDIDPHTQKPKRVRDWWD